MTDPVFMRRMNRMVTAPKRPAWLKRALNPNTPTTVAKESIRTASSGVGEGREILYPTIRMIDGELQQLTNKEAMDLAIKKGDYVEYDSIEEAEKASKKLSEHIGKERKAWKELTEDPKGFMEKSDKANTEYYANIKFGTPSDFKSGLLGYPKKPNLEKGILYEPSKSKAQILGGDFREYLISNRTSIPFMMLYDYFKEEK